MYLVLQPYFQKCNLIFLGGVLVSKNVFEVVHWKHENTGQEIAQEEEVLQAQLQVDRLRFIKPWLQVRL